MKQLLILLGMGTACILGYMAEPSLRFNITGSHSKVTTPISASREAVTAAPIDPATLTADQLPPKVSLKSSIAYTDKSSGLTLSFASGSSVKLIRVEAGNAIIRPADTTLTLVVPIEKTDLMEQVADNPPSTPVVGAAETPSNTPGPAPIASSEPTPTPAPIPAPEPTVNPAPVPQPAPAMEPAPAPEATPNTDPAAEPPPNMVPTPTPGAPVDVVKTMQESIKSGQIKEFTFEQVLAWKDEGTDTVGGESFQIGSCAYKAETIFGVKTIQAKALIKNGKVQRWIGLKSGMDIK